MADAGAPDPGDALDRYNGRGDDGALASRGLTLAHSHSHSNTGGACVVATACAVPDGSVGHDAQEWGDYACGQLEVRCGTAVMLVWWDVMLM
jgi:hypothetical protein